MRVQKWCIWGYRLNISARLSFFKVVFTTIYNLGIMSFFGASLNKMEEIVCLAISCGTYNSCVWQVYGNLKDNTYDVSFSILKSWKSYFFIYLYYMYYIKIHLPH